MTQKQTTYKGFAIGVGVLCAVLTIALVYSVFAYASLLRDIASREAQITDLQNQIADLQNQIAAAGTNSQVQVSGTVYGKQTGTIYFRTSNESVRTSSPITDGKYSVLLVGGQSYDIYIDHYSCNSVIEDPDFVLYVPLGVTVFSANF